MHHDKIGLKKNIKQVDILWCLFAHSILWLKLKYEPTNLFWVDRKISLDKVDKANLNWNFFWMILIYYILWNSVFSWTDTQALWQFKSVVSRLFKAYQIHSQVLLMYVDKYKDLFVTQIFKISPQSQHQSIHHPLHHQANQISSF